MTTLFPKPLDKSVSQTQDGLAIVANGDTHAAISSGQFVYVKNHDTLAEGLYKATSAIAQDGALSTSNLTADGSGGLNDLQGQVTALNSKITSQRRLATINSNYLSEGNIVVYDIGNLIFIQLADVKFKVGIANSSENNNIELITLPISASVSHVVFAMTPLNPNDKVIRLRAQGNKITPWWSTISVSQGEGYCGSVVINK